MYKYSGKNDEGLTIIKYKNLSITEMKEIAFNDEGIESNFDYVEINGDRYIAYGIAGNNCENWKILKATTEDEEKEALMKILDDSFLMIEEEL